jgi:ABC-type oligopeptide transport system ATPase subunit
MDRLVEIRGLVKEYHGRSLLARKKNTLRAVDRVSFDIERNTIFGLVGESGCGKTTLSRAVLYLDPPSAGEVRIGGTSLAGLPPRALRAFRRRMQIVFQDPNGALNPKMRVRDSLEEGLANLGLPRAERRERVDAILDLVGIPPAHASRHPHEFSGGQKQRLVVARALTMEPEFLVLDEPVSNLDVSIQAQIINLLLDIKEKLSLTYLFISHDLNLVAYLSDRIGVMYRGRIVEMGSTGQIMDNPVHPYTLNLFASSPICGGPSAGGGRQAAGGAPAGGPGTAGAAPALAGETLASAGGAPGAAGGCPYAARCGRRVGTCTEREPELEAVGNAGAAADAGGAGEGHLVACLEAVAGFRT